MILNQIILVILENCFSLCMCVMLLKVYGCCVIPFFWHSNWGPHPIIKGCVSLCNVTWLVSTNYHSTLLGSECPVGSSMLLPILIFYSCLFLCPLHILYNPYGVIIIYIISWYWVINYILSYFHILCILDLECALFLLHILSFRQHM